MKNSKHFFVTLVFLLLMTNSSYSGGLMVTPHRVELSDKNKSTEVKLVNRSDDATTTYRISFVHFKMTEDGGYETIKDEDIKANGEEKFADDLIVYSPKKVTLKANETQTIRLMFKKPANLASGEYRSHLLLQEEAPADFGHSVEKKVKCDKKISVTLKPLFAISIPTIVKNGELNGKVDIAEVELQEPNKKNGDKKSLLVKLTRAGNSGVYSNIVATFTKKGSTDKQKIGEMNGIAVFYPYHNRNVVIPLDVPKNIKLYYGTIEVKVYARGADDESATDNAKNKLLSQKQISI